MSAEFRMPSLGADMDDGVITEWRVEPGDEVRRGQIVVVVETDKSDIEVEVFDDVVVEELLVTEGERVAVGTPIARFAPLGASSEPARALVSSEPGAGEAPSEPVAPAVTVPAAAASVALATEPIEPVSDVEDRGGDAPGVTSPLVRQLAAELDVDLALIRGSGPGRRVHRDDVLRAAAAVSPRPRVTPRARQLAEALDVDLGPLVAPDRIVTGPMVVAAHEGGAATSDAGSPSAAPRSLRPAPAPPPPPAERSASAVIEADPARRVIASLMSRSWAEIPHFHVARRVDLSAALERLQAVNTERPVTERILPAALFLHAVTRAAVQVPAVNGWWRDGRAHRHDHVDLGVVISRRGGGIVAPTIPRAELLSVDEMMVQLAGLAARVRAGNLRGSDVGEASLTVTNLGDLGADLVHGVIHPPQLALVGLGAIRDEVVAVDGLVGVRAVVHATLAGDHRGLDGLLGASFLARFAAALHESAASIPARQESS